MLSGRVTLIEDKTTDPLFMKEGASYYFYHTDHLGTPQKMTAVNGAVVWAAKYSSFGKADIDAASTITNNLRFAGQYFDNETELHYNYHRYYEPRSGRYISADPIGSSSGDNLYNYANNMPIQYVDVRGLYCEQITPWKRIAIIQSDTDKGRLVSRTIKGKWKKINEWVVIPLPGRNMPRGGGTAKIGYGCQWEKVGCQQTSIYERPVLYEANFKCGIDECPTREFEERRTKEFTKRFTEKKNIRCHFSSRKDVTFSWIKGGCQAPSY